MNHPAEANLQAYLDEELEGEQRRAVEAHLEACSSCQQRLAELVTLFEQLQAMPERSLSQDLSGQVVAAVRARRRESTLVARLAWAEALVVAGLGAVVWLFKGGVGFAGSIFGDLTAAFERLRGLAGTSLDLHTELVGELAITVENLFSDVAQFPLNNLAELPGWISWGPALALAASLWLIGNGVLLLEGRERRRRGTRTSEG